MGLSAMAVVGIAGAASAAYSAEKGSAAAKEAAGAQTAAANQALGFQQSALDQTTRNLAPFVNNGQDANNLLAAWTQNGGQLGQLGPQYTPYGDYQPYQEYQQFQPTMDQLSQTPGYQFQLDQGLKAVTNANAAKGLVGSGNQGRGLIDYAQGLAGTTYQQQLQNYMAQYQTGLGAHQANYTTGLAGHQTDFTNLFNADQTSKNNLYNRLLGISTLGENAAAQTGANSSNLTGQMSNTAIGAGQAQAAGTVGAANAEAQGVSSGLGSLSQAYFMNQLLNRYGGGTGGQTAQLAGTQGQGLSSYDLSQMFPTGLGTGSTAAAGAP